MPIKLGSRRAVSRKPDFEPEGRRSCGCCRRECGQQESGRRAACLPVEHGGPRLMFHGTRTPTTISGEKCELCRARTGRAKHGSEAAVAVKVTVGCRETVTGHIQEDPEGGGYPLAAVPVRLSALRALAAATQVSGGRVAIPPGPRAPCTLGDSGALRRHGELARAASARGHGESTE